MADALVVHAVLGVMVLLFVAAVAHVALRPAGLPFPLILLALGIALGELARAYPPLAVFGAVQLSPAVLTYIFLPTLVFQSAFVIDTRLLVRNLWQVLVLAVPAVVLSMLIAGAGIHLLMGMPLLVALLFGALISATDTTAALAVFEELGAPKRLNILVEGENLFNDATAVVLFGLVLVLLGLGDGAAAPSGPAAIGWLFVGSAFGGLAVGAVVGYAFGKLIEYIENNDLIEILLTTVMAYLSFLLADRLFDVSGIMAVVGAGLLLRDWGHTKFSPPTLDYLERFWEYLVFIANALLFLMIGLAVDFGELTGMLLPITIAIAISLGARALSIYSLFPLVNALPRAEKVDLRYQTTLAWGGLRGAMSLALALSLPATLPFRDEIVTITFGVVLFSLLVQGGTLRALMRVLGLDRATLPEQYVRHESMLTAKRRARQRLPELRRTGMFSASVVGELEQSYEEEERVIRGAVAQVRAGGFLDSSEELRLLRRRYLLVEKRTYMELFHNGQLSESVLKQLQHSVELQIDFLRTAGRLPSWTLHSPLVWKLESILFSALDAVSPSGRLAQRFRLNRLAARYEEHWARLVATARVLEELRENGPLDGAEQALTAELIELYERWHGNARKHLDSMAEQFPEYTAKVQRLMAARLCLQAEEEVIQELEHLEILPEREAKMLREEVFHKLRQLRRKPLQDLRPRPEEMLGKVPFFRELPAAEFDRVVPLLRARTFFGDELIIREGSMGDSLFLIARGVARVFIRGSGVPEVPIATLIAGDFFGEMALLTGEPRSASVRAVTDCMLYELRRDDLLQLQTICPTIAQVLESTYRARAAELKAIPD